MNVTSEIIAPGMPLTCRWERDVTLLRAVVALSAALSTACVSVAKQDHPQQITVKARTTAGRSGRLSWCSLTAATLRT